MSGRTVGWVDCACAVTAKPVMAQRTRRRLRGEESGEFMRFCWLNRHNREGGNLGSVRGIETPVVLAARWGVRLLANKDPAEGRPLRHPIIYQSAPGAM